MSKDRYTALRHVRLMLQRQGGLCPECKTILILGPRAERVNFVVEHCQALGRGGSNALKNKELRCIPCALKKTYHPRSRATTLGGDLFEIAKTKALKKARLHVVGKTRRKKKDGPRRPWRKGRKLQGRGFSKVHRPMRGKEEWRPITVHALYHGLALCRFSTEKPGDWPPGHKWQGRADVSINCPGCLKIEVVLRGRKRQGGTT